MHAGNKLESVNDLIHVYTYLRIYLCFVTETHKIAYVHGLLHCHFITHYTIPVKRSLHANTDLKVKTETQVFCIFATISISILL